MNSHLEYRTDDVGIEQNEEFDDFEQGFIESVKSENFVQTDRRLHRQTLSKTGTSVIMEYSVLDWLSSQLPLQKYKEDFDRLVESGFDDIIKEAIEDENSRRLMIFNDHNYREIFQCFTSFHFVLSGEGGFIMIVYQRSADLSKLKDDLIFFANIAKIFGSETHKKTTKIWVIYGNIHITKE